VALVRTDVSEECQFLQEPQGITSQMKAFFQFLHVSVNKKRHVNACPERLEASSNMCCKHKICACIIVQRLSEDTFMVDAQGLESSSIIINTTLPCIMIVLTDIGKS
jgi:hypothetical protein